MKPYCIFGALIIALACSTMPGAAQTSLVATGAVWKYLDTGADEGAVWRARVFDDSGWAQGPARLGYGGDGEVTTIGFGGDANNKYITTYFRHSFNVANAASLTSLLLGIQRDDGAIVYLNGTEVFRSNMPADPISYLTLAPATIGGADETTFFSTSVDAGLLLDGVNVLAAEVHQAAVNSSDLGFAAALTANAAPMAPTVTITAPTNNASFTSPVSITISATAADADGSVTLVEFFQGATKIGEDNTAPFSIIWPDVTPGTYSLTARATDNSGMMTTSTPVNITVVNGGTALVAPGSVWKYLDDGSNQGTDWRASTFDDAAWAQGPAQLGYGDGDEATVVSFGPDANAKHITTYFRQVFNVANPASVTQLAVRLLRDDGAVVYLNNVEIFRSNMPGAAVDYLTPALAVVGGVDESAFFESPVDPGLLMTGQNILAVEIHQESGTSSDISFDLALVANAPSGPGGNDLVVPGAVWKYLDDGSDQGSLWTARTFDDSGWAEGPAQLGYGDGDEATVVGFGPDANAKYITTYFRHLFNVADPATVTSLLLRLQRDDGAVVYLNQTEIFRSNMPVGGVDYLTQASSAVGGADEDAFFQNPVNPSLLMTGQNILAVEIHQDNGASSDISFDLELVANAAPEAPTVTLTAPATGTTFVAPEPITLTATAADADGTVSLVEFYSGATKIGQDDTAPFQFVWRGASVGAQVLTARATDNQGLMATSAPVNITVVFGGDVILASGQTWKYLDDGSDQGTTWRGSGFSDASWSQGPAQLGYGDGDEATVVGFGPDDTNKFITTYFRQTFTVANPAAYGNLLVRVLRDDGAVVYLNGTEVFRSNMPTGAVDFLTLAPIAVGGADEETFFQGPVAPGLLQTGQNLLAVEIHQSGPTSSDLGFDLILAGNVPTQNPTIQITSPTSGQTFNAVADVPIAVAAADFDGAVTQVQFRVNGTVVGVGTTPPFDFTATGLNVGSYTLLAVATDNLGNSTTSAPVTIQVIIGPLVGTGATWKYLDDGSDQGSFWTDRMFDDSSWSAGPAQLGYGDGDEATVVGFGPDSQNKYITTYFRHSFTVANPSAYTNLLLRLLRDDGAVVYINGDEVFRSNMPVGFIDYLTPAAANTAGANETTFFETNVDPDALLPGANVIAVEVHQDVGTSSDISMDLELIGQGTTVVRPTLSIRRVGNNVEINWAGSGFALQQAPAPTGPWTTIMPLVTSGPYTITGPVTGMQYYRLISQ